MEDNISLKELIEYPKQGILSKVVVKGKLNTTLFCMAQGTDIEEHTSTKEALVYVVEGDGIFTLEDKEIKMSSGVLIHMLPNQVHSISSRTNLSFLLMLV